MKNVRLSHGKALVKKLPSENCKYIGNMHRLRMVKALSIKLCCENEYDQEFWPFSWLPKLNEIVGGMPFEFVTHANIYSFCICYGYSAFV